MDPYYILPIDTAPLTGPEEPRYSKILRQLPDQLADLITDLESAKMLNSVTQQFALTSDQRRGLALFFLDVVLGFTMPTDLAGTLAGRIGADRNVALQILKEVESFILGRIGIPLADLAKSHSTPEVLELAGGQTALRYHELNDLMKDIEDLDPGERIKFMNSMKKDNRILILKALSQLKLATDASGRPVSFMQLATQEAPDFTAQDWLDFLQENPDVSEPAILQALYAYLGSKDRIATLFTFVPTLPIAQVLHQSLAQALARAKPSVVDYVRWSPYFSGVYHAEKGIDEARFSRAAELGRAERRHLVDPAVSDKIASMVRQGIVPENFGAAVAKVVFLLLTGEVQESALPELFSQRLGLGPEKGRELAARIVSELLPVRVPETTPVAEPAPVAAAPVPPPAEPPPIPVVPLPPRPGAGPNVVDLRKRP